MKNIHSLALIATSLVLLACGPDKTPVPKLFEDQRNALDKAKTVEKTVEQQTQQLQQNVEKQTQ